jgi:hypothetical protein
LEDPSNFWWDEDGRKYRLVNPELVSYPRHEIRKVNGRNVRVSLPPLEYTIVTAVLVRDVPAALPSGVPKKASSPEQAKRGKLVK